MPDDYRESSGTKGLPGYVILGDRALSTVIMGGVGREERGKLWPLDFTDGGDVIPDRARACEAAMDDTGSIYGARAADGAKILLKGKLRLGRARNFPTRRLVPICRPPTPVQPLTAFRRCPLRRVTNHRKQLALHGSEAFRIQIWPS